MTTTRSTATGRHTGLVVHRAALDEDETTTWYGTRVTAPARTICDLARHDRHEGLMAADAALRERLVTRSELQDAAVRGRGWFGGKAASWVAERADPKAESPLESLTRACLADAGLPVPELQVRIDDPGGSWWCRVDLLFRSSRTVVEADGRVKYSESELWREKRRQERIERLGYQVVRVLWDDVVHHPDETAHRVRAALNRPARPE